MTMRRHLLVCALLLCVPQLALAKPATLGQQLGRIPRIHIARGLWWDMHRLHEAIAAVGGGQITFSHDVYGDPQGYHGCGRPLETFPRGTDLAAHDLIVLAGARIAALNAKEQSALANWVRRGGGLLVLGGPMSLDRDEIGPDIRAALPFNIAPAEQLQQLSPPGELRFTDPAFHGSQMVAHWLNGQVTPKDGTEIFAKVGEKAVLCGGTAGHGRIVVWSGTLCGVDATGQAFWQSAQWPMVLGEMLRWLAAATATAPAAAARAGAATADRLNELQDIAEEALDELSADIDGGSTTTGSAAIVARVKALARFCEDRKYAAAVCHAVAASGLGMTTADAHEIWQHIADHVAPDAAALKSGQELASSVNPGRLVLAIGILAGQRQGRELALRLYRDGISSVQETDAGDAFGTLTTGTAVMATQNGDDERLRLAAVEALAKLGDRNALPAINQAFVNWQSQKPPPTPLTENVQLALTEASHQTMALLGAEASAVWCIETLRELIQIQEKQIDALRKTVRNPSKQHLRQMARYRAQLPLLAERQARLQRTLSQLPDNVLPALLEKARSWQGPVAERVMLMTFCIWREQMPTDTTRPAWQRLAEEAKIPAIRTLAGLRVASGL